MYKKNKNIIVAIVFILVISLFTTSCEYKFNIGNEPVSVSESSDYYSRLPLESLKNVRELGGYPIKDKKSTKYHSFLRSDNLTDISARDAEFLTNYGVKTIIDLRKKNEIDISPDKLSEFNQNVNYYNSVLDIEDSNEGWSARVEKYEDGTYKDASKGYISILEERKDAVKNVFDLISSCDDGIILFHCKSGKDRTGLLSMLLLGLADVSKEDIVANYSVSSIYLNNPNSKCPSYPENMEKTLEHIYNNYGSVDNYLVSCGISSENLSNVKARLA